MAKKRDMYYSPLPGAMRGVLIGGIILCAGFALAYHKLGFGWMYSCAITCGVIAYHMAVRFLSPVLLGLVFHRKYDYQSPWFQPRGWEEKFYLRLSVPKWKGRALTYAPDEFSLRLHSLEEIIGNMCHAEAVHELIVPLSLASVLFALPFGSFGVFAITAVTASLFDLSFVMIQRYNRPRMVQILKRRQDRAA